MKASSAEFNVHLPGTPPSEPAPRPHAAATPDPTNLSLAGKGAKHSLCYLAGEGFDALRGFLR